MKRIKDLSRTLRSFAGFFTGKGFCGSLNTEAKTLTSFIFCAKGKEKREVSNIKKKYLSDILEKEYRNWWKKKVFLIAPTGVGKTTLIIKVLLPYFRERKKRMLILCNRKLLRQQYWFDLVRQYDNYQELEEHVQIMTYQKLADLIYEKQAIECLFAQFEVIVCDEAHYFYADSDFNGNGTYVLLQAIVSAGMTKTMLFLSATMDEVGELIERTIKNCYARRERLRENLQEYIGCAEIVKKDFSVLADYGRFQCICEEDLESLCGVLLESEFKSLLFVDDKELGVELRDKMLKTGRATSNDIVVLNADNLDSELNSKPVRDLAIGHRLACKILITTAVLDNGVSIHDSQVKNVAIITESKISFLQMLGRIRSESVAQCNLYFIRRSEEVFRKRMERYREDCESFNRIKKPDLQKNPHLYLRTVWENTDIEQAGFYRKALVLSPHNYQFFSLPETKVVLRYGNAGIYLNEFSRRKTGDMYLAESNFYALAVDDPLKVIYEQMRWIGKEPDELKIKESQYLKVRQQQMRNQLLIVQKFDNKALQAFKRDIVKNYRREFFADIMAQNGTLSTEKLKTICHRFGLKLSISDDSGRRKNYSIVEAGKEEEDYDAE